MKILRESKNKTATDLVIFAYHNFPNVAFTGEGKTNNSRDIVLYFDLKGFDKEKFTKELKNKYGDAIDFAETRSEYAPEIKHFVVIVKK